MESGSKIAHLREWAFSYCSSHRSIYLPASIKTISTSRFKGCGKLMNIVGEAGSRLSPEAFWG
jgi:hypothetical protein